MKINLKQIVEGFKNLTFPKEELKEKIEQVREERLAKCLNCPFNSTKGEITTFSYCKACGCNLKAKTSCLSCRCGMEHWNENNPDNIKPLAWDAVLSQEEEFDLKENLKEDGNQD